MRDTIDMAREAGFREHNGMVYVTTINDNCAEELKRLVALVRADEREETNRRANASWARMCEKMVAAEREACAKVCDDLHPDWKWRAAESIRARGNT